MPKKLGKALGYAVLIWLIGFIWGSVVFMTPALKNLPSIPYVSRYPAISFPLLIVWPIVIYLLAKNYLRTAADKVTDGLRLGITLAAVNMLLDLLVLDLMLKAGGSYFISLTVWVGYLLLLVIPWLVGLSLQKTVAIERDE